MLKDGDKQKYLTEIKELPPEPEEVEEKKPQASAVKKVVPAPVKNEEVGNKAKKPDIKPVNTLEKAQNGKSLELDLEEDEVEEKMKLPISAKDVILGIIDIVSVILIVVFLLRFPTKAQELKDHRIEEIKNESNFSLRLTDIEAEKVKGDKLSKLFLDESGVVDFVNEVEKLRIEGGSIKKLSFTKQDAIRDRTGNYGIPVIIEMEGSWESISQDLLKIDQLPFLFRAANIQAETSREDENVVTLKYGLFLYVNDKLGKN